MLKLCSDLGITANINARIIQKFFLRTANQMINQIRYIYKWERPDNKSKHAASNLPHGT